MIRCDKDEHYYDAEKHTECPFCRETNFIIPTIEDEVRSPDEKTMLVEETSETEHTKTRVLFGDKNNDLPPTVGWLVVADGEGKGRDISISPGQNRIGRDTSMDICINYGDSGISRKEHAFLIYDPKNHAYYIKHGGSQNLTYLNNAMVMEMQVLKAYDRIQLGETELLFIPLCSEAFNWSAE